MAKKSMNRKNRGIDHHHHQMIDELESRAIERRERDETGAERGGGVRGGGFT